MRRRDAARYVDDLVRGRRPGPAQLEEGDADTIRTAIRLKAARSDEAEPRQEWMSQLHSELAGIHGGSAGVAGSPSGRRPRRTHNVLGIAAASVALVGATVAITSEAEHGSRHPGPTVTAALHDGLNRPLGNLSLYRGHPSWVFLDVVDPGYSGPAMCQLQNGSGNVILTGTFELQHGQGDWARTIGIDPTAVRAARVIAPGGRTLAYATFPAGAGPR